MAQKYDAKYLAGLAEAVGQMLELMKQFLALHTENETFARGIAPAVWANEDADPEEVARLKGQINRLAGRAKAATPITGMMYVVQGYNRPVDPIADWLTITQPKPLLEASNVLGALEQILGTLEGMIAEAEAEQRVKAGPEGLHPLIWSAARKLWEDGHYRHAVSSGADALIHNLKGRTRRNDVADTALWRETFSESDPKPGKPRLRWPGDPKDSTVVTMADGLRQYAPGVQMTIRNSAVHSNEEYSRQDALERLAAISLLARWVDQCDLLEADPGE